MMVDLYNIFQVYCGRFIGNVYRMIQWQIPYGESLKFSVPGIYTLFVIMI